MKNLIWQHDLDIGRVWPVSFDLSSSYSEEFKDFRETYKFSYVVSILKQAVANIGFIETNYNKVIIAMVIVERRNRVLSG